VVGHRILSGVSALWVAGLVAPLLLACGKTDQQAPAPVAPPAAPAALAPEASVGSSPAAASAPSDPAAAPPSAPPPPSGAAGAAAVAAVTPPGPDDGVSPLPSALRPGDVVRDTDPRRPEHVIAGALAAAREPDEAKGWAAFEALLHTDEKLPDALITRRSMNFAASRRKVHLFLLEDAPKPVFKVERIVEEGTDTVRFFVHNPKSMPTPCTARLDANLKPPAWRVGICSL
jgi:hypothetical protein